MSYNLIPPNANNQHSVSYNDPQYTTHEFEQGTIGVPHVAASGIATGNGAYPVFTAPVPCVIYAFTGTVTAPGTGAGSTVTLSLVRANNGANVSNTVTFQNVITTGANTSGNTFGVEFAYNVNALGANTGSNLVASGGVTCNAGDVVVGTHTGNTLVLSTVVEWAPLPSATLHN